MISLLPFSSHTTFLPPIRIQQTYAVFHLPFLFTLLPLETGETHRLWVCIFSHMSPAVFFVSHSLCQSFPSTVPFCLLCTLWASKMVCYSMSRFDLILHAERLLIYNLLWRGTAWLCMMCVHLQCQHQEPSWNRGRRHFHLCSNTVSALAPWHRCLCCTRQSLSSYHLLHDHRITFRIKSSSLSHEDKVLKSPWNTCTDNRLTQTPDIWAVQKDKEM